MDLLVLARQVDMVFEVRDARIPFTSANDDLDKIVGPSKARLIVLNKVWAVLWSMFATLSGVVGRGSSCLVCALQVLKVKQFGIEAFRR